MRDDDAADDRYTDLLAQLLAEIDTLDRQRGQLSQARTLAVNQLLSHLGVSRKALAAFSRFDVDEGLTAEVSLRAWIQLARESLPIRTQPPE